MTNLLTPSIIVILACMLFLFHLPGTADAGECSYQTWDWDVHMKKSVNHQKVIKERSDLSAAETGSMVGCTVCEEDQAEVRLDGLPAFKICKQIKARIIRSIQKAQAEGFPISSIIGYRVGKTKGPLNSLGQRTEFSNHSYGTAIDFNSERNGLYEDCFQFGPNCHLLSGGEYHIDGTGTITQTSAIYKAMRSEGFQWGGEINGKQKDFMHFSPDGK